MAIPQNQEIFKIGEWPRFILSGLLSFLLPHHIIHHNLFCLISEALEMIDPELQSSQAE
jgi:hypothetical protein